MILKQQTEARAVATQEYPGQLSRFTSHAFILVLVFTAVVLLNPLNGLKSSGRLHLTTPLYPSGLQMLSVDTYLWRLRWPLPPTTEGSGADSMAALLAPAPSIDTHLQWISAALLQGQGPDSAAISETTPGQDNAIASAAVPTEGTTAPKVRAEVVAYQIAGGDTLSGIAARFGVSQETLLWSNDIADPDRLKAGQKLDILPVSGVKHKVESGDTLEDIARVYKVDAKTIREFPLNKLSNPNVVPTDRELIIPGGVKPPKRVAVASAPVAPAVVAAVPAQKTSETASSSAGQMLQWPTYGPIYQYFRAGHQAIDISPSYGTPVYAAEAGTVTAVNWWQWGLGYHVIVDHGNGFTSTYAHLSQMSVQPGQVVQRGASVGKVGTTGIATGPHLHFVLTYNDTPVDPLKYLPR
ncbi:MAG: peptidase family protein [Dehalococcoidia bacterium]|nr:peptidase family protein [Dehalococcoidia bacterium]